MMAAELFIVKALFYSVGGWSVIGGKDAQELYRGNRPENNELARRI